MAPVFSLARLKLSIAQGRVLQPVLCAAGSSNGLALAAHLIRQEDESSDLTVIGGNRQDSGESMYRYSYLPD